MLKWLRQVFQKRQEESPFVEYHYSMFSIHERGPDCWLVEVALFMDESATNAKIVPLQPIFMNYTDAFMYLQGIGQLFCGLLPDVTVFNVEAVLIGRLDLTQSIQKETEPNLFKSTHPTNYTIN